MYDSSAKMIPVLQYDDMEQLHAAKMRLMAAGYDSRAGLMWDLPTSDRPEWVDEQKGGYLLLLPDDEHFESARKLLESSPGRDGS